MGTSLGLVGDIYMGSGAVQVAQLQIQTSGRNLSNSSTDGASRQSVVSTEGITLKIGGGDMSVGVTSLGLTTARSSYLDNQVQSENSNLGYATQMDSFTGETETALSENLSSTQLNASDASSQTGLISATTNFYDAWSQLSADPTSANYRDAVSSAAGSFVTTAKSIYNQLGTVKEGAFTEANTETDTVNSLATEIANDNVLIAKAEIGTTTKAGVPLNQASDLRDARQTSIEKLAKLVNITVSTNATTSDMVDISLTDSPTTTLVQGKDAAGAGTTSSLSVTGANSSTGNTGYSISTSLGLTATSATNGTTTVSPTGGSLGGLLNFDNNVLGSESTSAATNSSGSTLFNRFNTFVNNVVTAVNSAVTSGYDQNGSKATTPYFTTSSTSTTASTGAFDLNVNQVYDLNSSSYDSTKLPASTSSTGTLDGTNASNIAAQLKTSKILPAYQSTVTTVASDRSAAATNLSSQQLMSTQVTNQRSSVSGISTNDETTDLLTFQRAFEASSKFINTIDQMYQTIINTIG